MLSSPFLLFPCHVCIFEIILKYWWQICFPPPVLAAFRLCTLSLRLCTLNHFGLIPYNVSDTQCSRKSKSDFKVTNTTLLGETDYVMLLGLLWDQLS